MSDNFLLNMGSGSSTDEQETDAPEAKIGRVHV